MAMIKGFCLGGRWGLNSVAKQSGRAKTRPEPVWCGDVAYEFVDWEATIVACNRGGAGIVAHNCGEVTTKSVGGGTNAKDDKGSTNRAHRHSGAAINCWDCGERGRF